MKRVEVGFVPVDAASSLAFPTPRLLLSNRKQPLGQRAVQACPAVNTFENRVIEIPAPFSLRLRCVRTSGSELNVHIVDEGTRLDEPLISKFVSVMPREIWRDPAVPVVQIALPHFFICDDICYVTQTPSWASDSANHIPGRVISGRFPTHLWPRSLNLAFEWSNLDQDLILKRGEPCCYLLVEGATPELPVRLFAAKHSEELQLYRKKIEDVVRYTSGTFNLFAEAEKVRPRKLVHELLS